MNSRAIGLGVRFLRKIASIGGAGMRNGIGRIFTRIRPRPNCKVEFGRIAMNPPLSTRRTRSVIELDTTCGAGGVKPAAPNTSAISAMAMLSDCGSSHGSRPSSKVYLRAFCPTARCAHHDVQRVIEQIIRGQIVAVDRTEHPADDDVQPAFAQDGT